MTASVNAILLNSKNQHDIFFVDILHALNIFLIILFPEIIDKKKRYLYDLMLFISFISERKRAIHIFV